MNIIKTTALAACLGCVALTPAIGRQADAKKQLVITGEPSVTQWSADVGAKLDRNLYKLRSVALLTRYDGVVTVHFRSDETGRPTDISVVRSSGDPILDRTAERVIDRIETLYPLPRGVSADQQFLANIIFAENQASANRKIAALQAESASAASNPGQRSAGSPVMAMVGLVPNS